MCDPFRRIDVMGYHDGREIPNYWAYAKNFVLQDHMFEPEHLLEPPDASVHGLGVVSELQSQTRPAELPERGRVAGPATRWTRRTARVACRLTLDRPDVPAAQAPAFPGGTTSSTAASRIAQTTPRSICPPKNAECQDAGNLESAAVVRHRSADHQLGNIQPRSASSRAAQAWDASGGFLGRSRTDKVSEHPPARVSAGQAYVTGLDQRGHARPGLEINGHLPRLGRLGRLLRPRRPARRRRATATASGCQASSSAPMRSRGYIDHQTLSFDAYAKFIEDDFLGGQRLDPATDGRPDSRPDSAREHAGARQPRP